MGAEGERVGNVPDDVGTTAVAVAVCLFVAKWLLSLSLSLLRISAIQVREPSFQILVRHLVVEFHCLQKILELAR